MMAKILDKRTNPEACDDDFSVVAGSGNVFVDLGFDAAEAAELTLKSVLVEHLQMVIRNTMAQENLTQRDIADRLDVDQPKVSKILNGQISGLSIDRLTQLVLELGYDINIQIQKAPTHGSSGALTSESVMSASP